MTKKDKISLGIAVGAAAAVWFLERKLNTSSVSGIGSTITPTGNEKTTIREAWKNREFKNEAWVIFKDVAEPKENQVWIIKEYDRSEREYYLINWGDTSREKWCNGDKVCFTGFYF